MKNSKGVDSDVAGQEIEISVLVRPGIANKLQQSENHTNSKFQHVQTLIGQSKADCHVQLIINMNTL